MNSEIIFNEMIAYDFSNLNAQQEGNDNCFSCPTDCDNCNCVSYDNIQTREVEKKIFNEVKNASSIFGVFDLKLGQTTKKDLDHEYEKQKGEDFFENRICFYTRRSYGLQEKEYLKNIKLYFLDNILVIIEFNPCKEYKEEFIKKYGQGIGAYIKYEKIGIRGKNKNKIEDFFDESRNWENATIDVLYSQNTEKYTYAIDHFTFTLKNKWILVQELKVKFLKKKEEEKKEKERQEHLEKERLRKEKEEKEEKERQERLEQERENERKEQERLANLYDNI